MKKFNFVIPAAGRGSRLMPLTNQVPKCLVNVLKCTILEHQLNCINPIYVQSLTVVLGYKGQKIIRYIKNLNLPYEVFFVENPDYNISKCGTSLIKSFENISGSIIFLNSDLLFSKNIVDDLVFNQEDNVIVGKSMSENFRINKYHAKLNNREIVDIEYSNTSYDFELIGPVKMSFDVPKEIKKRLANLRIDINTMSCFSLIKLVLRDFNFVSNDCSNYILHEIDTIEDLKTAESLLNK